MIVLLQRAEPAQDRDDDAQIEQRVHDREAAHDGLHQARRERDRRNGPGARTGDAGGRVAERPAHRDRGQRRRQPQREGRDAEQLREQGRDPEEKGRLDEPLGSIEVHDDPIVHDQHFTGDLAVDGLAVIP